MKFKYYFISIILLFILSTFLYCQVPKENGSAFEGKHFFVGFMQNEIDRSEGKIQLQIYITSTLPGNAYLFCPGIMDLKYPLIPNKVLRIDCPLQVEDRTDEIPLKDAIEITSDVPIVVYSFNSQDVTSDAYTAIPVPNWGNEYVIISMPNDQYAMNPDEDGTDSTRFDYSRAYPRSSEFMVIAAYDGTTIQFQPKAVTLGGKQTYKSYTQVLNQGQCYLVQSFLSPRGTADLSGTIVTSDKPIGVISGHVRTAIPQNPPPMNSKNHLCEMLPPTTAWGKEFISVPFGTNDDGDWFKVAAILPNTIVTYQNTQGITQYIVLNNPGDVASVFYVPNATVWQSNNPIEIGQFMMHKFDGSDYYGDYNDTYFDPSFVILSPTENFVSHIIFETCGNNPYLNPLQFYAQYISVVADFKALSTLTLDGTVLKDTLPNFILQSINGTPYYWERIQIRDGTHELACKDGSFSGVIYGTGPADAYAMTLGSSLNNIYKTDTIPPTFVINDSCGKIYGTVTDNSDSTGSGVNYLFVIKDSTINYQYQIGTIADSATSATFSAQPINVLSDGKFVIEARDKNGNGTRYRYFYQGIKLIVPDTIDFQTIFYKDSACIDFLLINKGADIIKIDSLTISDKRISIKEQIAYPKYISGFDTLFLHLCCSPRRDTSAINGIINLQFDCNRIYTIPVKGFIQPASLATIGYDFGKKRIGDTSCADVKIINDGFVSLTLSSLTYTQNPSEINYDTTGLFPIIFQTGDTLTIPVCFLPDSLGQFISLISAVNDRNILNSLSVTGEGVAPQFESIVVDWKNRRVGTKNDTTVYLKNSGNCEGVISYIQFANSPDGFDTSSIAGINQKLQPGDSIPLN
ncbi:MAG: IgGFc-binding protein, partial [FCB group bacterium]